MIASEIYRNSIAKIPRMGEPKDWGDTDCNFNSIKISKGKDMLFM